MKDSGVNAPCGGTKKKGIRYANAAIKTKSPSFSHFSIIYTPLMRSLSLLLTRVSSRRILSAEGQCPRRTGHHSLLALHSTAAGIGARLLESKRFLSWRLFLSGVLWHADEPVNEYRSNDVKCNVHQKEPLLAC